MKTPEEIADELRAHVCDRGGPSIENGVWQLMLDAADALSAERAEAERMREERDALQADIAAKWQPRQDELIAERDAARRDLAEAVEVLRSFVRTGPRCLVGAGLHMIVEVPVSVDDRARTLLSRMQSKEKVDG